MSSQTDHTIVRLRVPPALKEQIEKAAEENNRSQSAEMVSRLEQSFAPRSETSETLKNLHKELREDLIAQSYKVAKHRYDERHLIALDQMYEYFERRTNNYRYLIKSIENGTYTGAYETDPVDQALIKYKILANEAQNEAERIKIDIKQTYEESNVDQRFLLDNELQSIIKIIENKLPE